MRIAKLLILIIIIGFLSLSFGCYYNARLYADTVAEISAIHNVDPYLALAVCQAESGFDPNAVSRAGAVGVMQLLPKTAQWICAKRNILYEADKLYDKQFNIDLGVWYLNYLSYFDNTNWQVAAYNAGEGTVNNWIKQGITVDEIPYSETKAYLERVNRYYDIFKKQNIIK